MSEANEFGIWVTRKSDRHHEKQNCKSDKRYNRKLEVGEYRDRYQECQIKRGVGQLVSGETFIDELFPVM